MNLTHASLFSGIGGIDLAAEAAGFETKVQVEINPFAEISSHLDSPQPNNSETLEKSRGGISSEHAEDIPQYYQAASRVSPSASRESGSAAKTNGGCGQSTLDSFGKANPLGLLLRMLPLSPVFQSSGKYTQTLEPKVTKSGFCIYELRMSGRRTSGQDVSLLPTPTANLFKNQKVSPCRVYSPQSNGFKRLAVEAAKIEAGMILLPTPTASQDYKPICEKAPSEKAGTHGTMLCAALAEKGIYYLPTPLASVNEPIRPFKAKELMRHTKGAKRFGKMLPGQIGDAMPSLIGKTIHPLFVEWMMGFPNGWTEPDCKLSATQLYRGVPSLSSKQSQKLKEAINEKF